MVIFLRGGMDGLSLVVPYGDDLYYKRRRRIAVPRSKVHDLDGYFGLNDAAGALLPLYESGRLAIAQLVGHVQASRSHFQSMRHIEEANAEIGTLGSGWIARHLAHTPASGTGPARAIALQSTLPPALQGGPATVPVPSLASFGFRGPASGRSARMACLERMYASAPEPHRSSGVAALGLVHELAAIDFVHRKPAGGAEYPKGKFGRALYETASLIKSRTGVEVIEADFGGWDDHRDLGPTDGAFAARAHELSEALGAFMTDLGDDAERVTILVLSEFGRGAGMNGSGGTSHGRGGTALVLGGAHVQGGRIHGAWPGLGRDQLDNGAIQVTLDVRDLLSETLSHRLGTSNLDAVLPGHSPTPLGILSRPSKWSGTEVPFI
ncbi:DUF1501 domain-containing protein [Saltatorellus ferox]|uniref:DUF1501 domain-containing protein n=1 Tax=Saltatorellus ferox TaxID=2528018 RepID=UPI003AF3B6BB